MIQFNYQNTRELFSGLERGEENKRERRTEKLFGEIAQ